MQGGASFFFAFAVGTPIRIVDGNPSLDETVTPTSVVYNNDTCAISVAPVNSHQSPATLQSATGGLQESLTANMATPATNTVILNSAWYQSVGSSNAAAVIAAAKGSARLGLVDVTTVPTSYYSWNGTQYVQVASGGGATSPATNLVLKGTGGPNGIISAIPGSDYVIPSGSILGTAAATVPGITNVLKGSGTAGVSVAALPGTDYVIPSGNVATATAAQHAGTPCLIGFAPTGVDTGWNSLNCQAVGGGGGGGSNLPGAAFQLGGYQTSGTTIGPVNNVYSMTPTTSLVQANALFAALPAGTSTVIVPDGTAQIPWTNTAVQVHSFRLGDDYLQMARYGIACDEQHFSVTLTAGSNQFVRGAMSAADIGKTLVVAQQTGFGYQAPQQVWIATVTAVTGNNITLSANAPFSYTGDARFGTLNTAAIQSALNNATFNHPLTIPSGCQMLTGTLQWNNAQSIIGQNMNTGGFVAAGPVDILQQPDAAGAGSATRAGTRLENIGFDMDSSIDPTLGYTSYNPAGTPTVVPPLYRPLHLHAQDANNPLAPGWAQGATNGVASITQNSAVICVPTALGRVPVIGQTIVFPYTTAVFTSIVTSNTGAGCASGFTGSTMVAAFPNTSGYTVAQAEWVSTSSAQATTTAIPTTPTYPFTITLTNPIQPTPGFESNVATHGHIKIGSTEFDYMGVNGYGTNVLTIRRGPATTPGYSGTNTVVPLNPCPAKNMFGSASDQPWPVIPSINTNDSTPSGANWFPGECVGAAAISFPTANGNVHIETGLSNSFLENLQFQVTGSQLNNGTAALYEAGNTPPYGTLIDGFSVNYLEYGIAQGPASAGQHGVGPVGPTATGNTLRNLSIHAAYPLTFMDMQQSSVSRADTYSTEISPYDGTAVGVATCLLMGYSLDEQTGALITNTSRNSLDDWNCEPEGGSGIEVPVYAELDQAGGHYKQDQFEGSFTIVGGGTQVFENDQWANPIINYGRNNSWKDLDGSSTQYITNKWDSNQQFINWGVDSNCSNFAGGQGPQVPCGAGFVQTASGHSIGAAVTGNANTGHPYENETIGQITPGEWGYSGNPSIMSVGFAVDQTEPYWGSYAGCNLGGAAQCRVTQWEGFNGNLFIGSHNRIVDGPYVLSMDVKSASASSQFNLQVAAFDNGSGQCSASGVIVNQNVTTGTTWANYSTPIDFTGKAGCILSVQFSAGTTTDQLRVGYFNFVPVPQWQILAVATPTLGNACPVNGTMLGSDSSNLYMCSAGIVKGLPFGSGGLTNPMTTLGDTIYGGASGTPTRLPGNTSTTPAIAVQTGTGSVSAAPIVTAATGTGSPVLATSPSLVTPSLGAATATSVTISGPATGIAGLGTATFSLGATGQVGTSPVAPACGTGFNCDSLSGTFFFTTGTGSLAPGTIVTVTLPGTRTFIPTCPVTIKGSGSYVGVFAIPVNTSGVITIPITNEVALLPSTTYTLTYGTCGGI